MPFSGLPGPERAGGGENNTSKPLVRIVYESLCAQHGSAYAQDWPPATPFGIEMLAYARAITYDLFGANQRLANQFIPQKMTADGLMPRWEAIFNVPALPGDTEPTRRTRVGAAFGRLGKPNTHQPIVDVLTNALGILFTGTVTYQGPNTANVHWPGNGSNTSLVPWWSSIDQINILVTIPAAYLAAGGGPNAAWWSAIGQANPKLDAMLPSWVTWVYYVLSSHGTACFYLDEPNLDLEVFC